MKKKLLLITLCIIATLTTAAQTQHGIVRTPEKPNRPSVGIEGATVSIQYQNDVTSKKGGKFSISIKNKKPGDSFKVTRVQKKGYTLVDKMLQGRNFAVSSSVPIEIVMVSDKQLANDKKRIEDKAYAKAKKTYEVKIAALERQLEEKTISEQDYYKERERLGDNYDEYLKLIDEMAERYAMTDYQGLSDINRQIMECIENAELERADSLINSKGDFDKREQELREQMELNQATAEYLEKSRQDAEFKLNDLAQDYYNKFTIFASNFQNDSAAYYLERRAALDTTNIEWQNQAGIFIGDRINNYQLALKFFKRGLYHAEKQYGEESEWTATFCSNLGGIYELLNSQKALEYSIKALSIFEKIPDINQWVIAANHTRLGNAYSSLNQYDKALEHHLTALNIQEKQSQSTDSESYNTTASAYFNLGSVYYDLEDYDTSLEYLFRALEIFKNVLNDESNIAKSYHLIGAIHLKQGKYDSALEYFRNALTIHKKVLGIENTFTADDHNNIGSVYEQMGNHNKALEHFLKALEIVEKTVGKEHPSTAELYNNIGTVYNRMGDSKKAFEFEQESLTILEQVLGKDHINTATCYANIASTFYEQGDYSNTIEYLLPALDTYEKVLGAENSGTLGLYEALGLSYNKLNEYNNAVIYYSKLIKGLENTYGETEPEMWSYYYNLGMIYNNSGSYSQAIHYFSKAIVLQENSLGINNPDLVDLYHEIGNICIDGHDYPKAQEIFNKALHIVRESEKPDNDLLLEIESRLNISKYLNALHADTIQEFMTHHCFTQTIVGDSDCPARLIGMEGEYILLEFGDWVPNSPISLFDKNTELKGKPKDIVVLKDGVISKYHFENVIGAQFGIKEITKEERAIIDSLYHKWKNDPLFAAWESRKQKHEEDFKNNFVLYMTVHENLDSTAMDGLNGEYCILEYNGIPLKDITSDIGLFNRHSTEDQSLDIVLLKDGVITRHHFEKVVSTDFGSKRIGKEERERINKLYEQWKRENK